ncbi:MAG: hypothetical protein E4H17_00530 [Gemmatimonadales bacterium]|nr:MAG: hypothetical protein E4H17_00530 [Gemmatimonadales bacterium]
MQLLPPTQPAELPTEALLARLRCRRAGIDLAADQGAQAPAAEAVNWVYRRLNGRLRTRLTPFLDLLAMRNLVLTLRYTLAGEKPPAAALHSALLAAPLQRLAAAGGDAEGTVARLETALARDYPFVSGLTINYRRQGPGGVEQQLTAGILQHGLARPGSVLLKGALRYLVDVRNCLMVHKLWRWQFSQAPPLVAGGSIAATSLRRIWATRDSDRLARLVAHLAGEPCREGKTMALEQCLLHGMTRLVRQAGRDPLGLGVIIDYLWRAQLMAHNQVLRQTLAADRDELLGEVLLL